MNHEKLYNLGFSGPSPSNGMSHLETSTPKHLKIDGWKMKFPFWDGLGSGAHLFVLGSVTGNIRDCITWVCIPLPSTSTQ